MRPNIDIPWDVHGGVKEYAEKNNISLEQAYTKVLKRGLPASPMADGKIPHSESEDTVFIQAPDGHIARVCTFSNGFRELQEPEIFRTRQRFEDPERVESLLSELARFEFSNTGHWNENHGTFTIHQSNGAWIGSGLRSFFELLQNPDKRNIPVDYEVDTYKNDSAIYICETNNPQIRGIALSASPRFDSDSIEDFHITFITDGGITDNRNIIDYAEAADVDLTTANSWNPDREIASDLDSLELEPMEKLTLKRGRDEEEWVYGIICKNPFFNDEELYEEKFDMDTDTQYPVSMADKVTSYKSMYCKILDHHPVDEEKVYDSRIEIEVTDMSALAPLSGFSVANVYAKATW
ncbi:hypothetical protein EGH25_10520 [Haladaptatus sp. F3-133]|uniref:Uncharacterized protein n=1 Tax=Halorutilus salinus TaxID=2487751 RepID=A0A9Q4C641_9EURY|nr:hypothetical protein [Halorutilus salinus]MCX2819782.1 hypothetical protein [Halorutilus salinus]